MEGHQSKIDDDIVAHVQLMRDDLEKQPAVVGGICKGTRANATQKQVSEMAAISAMHEMMRTQSAALRRIAGRGKVRMHHRLKIDGRSSIKREMESMQQNDQTPDMQRRISWPELLANADRKKTIDHHEQVRSIGNSAESLSEQVKSTSGSLILCHHNVGRLNRLAEFRIPGIEFRSGRNEEDIKSLIMRLRLLETVVRDPGSRGHSTSKVRGGRRLSLEDYF